MNLLIASVLAAAVVETTSLLPPAVAAPERVQTYRIALVGQSLDGQWSCETNWLDMRATNEFALKWAMSIPCTTGVKDTTHNFVLLWSVTNQPTVWQTNVGMVFTQHFTVTTNAPFLKTASPPPPPVTNFSLTIYGSTNLVDWYTLTNLYVPNAKPFEWLKAGLTPK